MRKLFVFLLLVSGNGLFSQEKLTSLSVEKIMRDPKWIGSSPSNIFWGKDGTLYFNWNPDKAISDSLYYISIKNIIPQKTTIDMRQKLLRPNEAVYNSNYSQYTFSKDGDIFFTDIKTGKERRITATTEAETQPLFSFNDSKIVYTRNQNLYAWDIADGLTTQLTNFQKSATPPKKDVVSAEEKWLKSDQLQEMEVLRSRKEKKDLTDSLTKKLPRPKTLKPVYLDDKILSGLSISPDGRFISYRLIKPSTNAKNTVVPAYVTESGFTEDIAGRTKVGAPAGTQEFFVFDSNVDSAILIKTTDVPGIKDIPEYFKNYPSVYAEKVKKPIDRIVSYNTVSWSPKGTKAILEIYASDYKDRWIMLMEPITGKLSVLDRQHDSAWISGPGIGGGFVGGANSRGWIDENTFWFQSEASGYSHLYTVNTNTAEKKALTSGRFEVQQAQLSRDKKYFYIITNEVHPGEQQFYRLPANGGKAERITTMTGANQVSVSPDEKTIAFLYSYSNKPWELFVQENKPGGKLQQVTAKAESEEFKSYAWRDPELINFTARDGATVYARLFRPANANPSKPAVIFVHGAGYLQNAHKWWSSYFREYMFHNLLADNGYTVLDIDYRASAGYGRDWRTGIYRFMGGKDLTDNIDGAKLLVEKYGVDPKHIGIYGGSYGGFITLMALFTEPGVFKAGAALRPVTDWANYNHGYTANILNEPFNDSIAYKRSSPIYFANGLKDHLLICHGMMDVNVHFQDAIKLTQRLIELGKDNWEIAPFPMEDHGFIEPSSWTDEYKRIFRLFETQLK